MHLDKHNIDKLIFIWSPYNNVSAVNCAHYIWKTRHCGKLDFNVGLLSHNVGKSDILSNINAIQDGNHYWAYGAIPQT